jgi:hypothetical protein
MPVGARLCAGAVVDVHSPPVPRHDVAARLDLGRPPHTRDRNLGVVQPREEAAHAMDDVACRSHARRLPAPLARSLSLAESQCPVSTLKSVTDVPERVREIEDWFADRDYILWVHPVPHGGFFAPYFPAHSTGGTAPFTWGPTAEEAAEAALVQFRAAHPDLT